MNLAAWKYRNILRTSGGPLKEIAVRYIPAADTRLARPVVEAMAYIDQDLCPGPTLPPTLYGSPTGTGTGFNKIDAVHRAISEAMERWAFYELKNSEQPSTYGFDVDPGTTGMAAFPGLFSQSARVHAQREGLERWSICAWWEGRLKAELSQAGDLTIVKLRPTRDSVTLILATTAAPPAPRCYGFACSSHFDDAFTRAVIELERNQRVLASFYRDTELSRDIAAAPNVLRIQEQRVLWFATLSGGEAFDQKVAESARLRANTAEPMLVFDGELPGPWRKYASVWRTLYRPLSDQSRSDRLNYFFF